MEPHFECLHTGYGKIILKCILIQKNPCENSIKKPRALLW